MRIVAMSFLFLRRRAYLQSPSSGSGAWCLDYGYLSYLSSLFRFHFSEYDRSNQSLQRNRLVKDSFLRSLNTELVIVCGGEFGVFACQSIQLRQFWRQLFRS